MQVLSCLLVVKQCMSLCLVENPALGQVADAGDLPISSSVPFSSHPQNVGLAGIFGAINLLELFGPKCIIFYNLSAKDMQDFLCSLEYLKAAPDLCSPNSAGQEWAKRLPLFLHIPAFL